MALSTQNIIDFPDIETLKARLIVLATLDAILSPEWGGRYYSFDPKWGKREQMGSMRNGSGDEFFTYFSSNGAIIFGFDHESPMSPYNQTPKKTWPGVLEDVPSAFRSALDEPAFSNDDTTFCIWRESDGDAWQTGKTEYPERDDPDGSQYLLSHLDGDPLTYYQHATEYFECDPCFYSITQIYKHAPLTDKLVSAVNPELELKQIEHDIKQIGYPTNE